MRNISFFLTTEQFRGRSKDVTRRLGWSNLKPGTRLMGCVKCQGLKPGEPMERLGVVEVTSVCREQLSLMVDYPDYGKSEALREGFPEMSGPEFVEMFCEHMKVKPDHRVTRIEFRYVHEENLMAEVSE